MSNDPDFVPLSSGKPFAVSYEKGEAYQGYNTQMIQRIWLRVGAEHAFFSEAEAENLLSQLDHALGAMKGNLSHQEEHGRVCELLQRAGWAKDDLIAKNKGLQSQVDGLQAQVDALNAMVLEKSAALEALQLAADKAEAKKKKSLGLSRAYTNG